jgi:pantothenate kinase
MDGYHLTRAQLSALPDPVTAHARRGAEFTFDGASFLTLVRRLRGPRSNQQLPSSSSSFLSSPPRSADGVLNSDDGDDDNGIIYAPSFDHALKDPVENSISILPLPAHRIVVVEGIYVLLDKSPWREAAELMDLKVFVKVDREIARGRLARRHVAAGIVETLEEGDRRARENDLVNGDMIESLLMPVDEVLESREDVRWVHA